MSHVNHYECNLCLRKKAAAELRAVFHVSHDLRVATDLDRSDTHVCSRCAHLIATSFELNRNVPVHA